MERDRDAGSTEELEVQPGLTGRLFDGVGGTGRQRRTGRTGRLGLSALGGLAIVLFVANGLGLFGGSSDAPKPDRGKPVSPGPSITSAPRAELRLSPALVDQPPMDALTPGTFAAGNVLRLGGRGYRLPSDWAVLSMVTARDGLVLHIVLPNAPNGPWAAGFAIYVGPDGTYREIPGAYLPFRVNPAGTLLVAAAEHGADLQPGPEKLAAFALPSGAPRGLAPLPAQLRAEGFASSDQLLVTAEGQAPQLWNPLTGSLTALSRGRTVLATSATGDRLVAADQGTVIEQTTDGGERWKRPAFGAVVGYSPPGDLLAALTPAARPTGLTVRSVTSGGEVQRFQLAAANRPGRGQAIWAGWADDRSLIVQTGGEQGVGARYARCTIATTTCVDLGSIPTQLLFPGQLFFE